ncbi:CYTH domain-containing protein [Candidatus Woesebacteria bacterium]|nr:MAG: CYTH domain-containing protein [Candidatus Woesebacteria bacterium]
MDIEWEAKFSDINKNEIRSRLAVSGAQLVKPEFLQKRVTFNLPTGHELEGAWVRVRDEGDKFTMSLKIVSGDKIQDQKEIALQIDNFENARTLLTTIGCDEKSYQENKRELWILDGVEITLDEWPYLEPFVEIEGKSEAEVRRISEELGFDWSKAIFGSTHFLTSRKYHIPESNLNNEIPRIVFNEPNPYVKWLEKNKR